MSAIPRVAESTREQVTREFDDLGPDACVAEISAHLREHNPEWLSLAAQCAADSGDPERTMKGFCMFYRLLIAQAAPDHPMTLEAGAPAELNPLPHITASTRGAMEAQIDKSGSEKFLKDALAELEGGNPELLQMAHYFASAHENYLGVMHGFALLYTALSIQAQADKLSVH
ncbi:MAG: hypothetical protein JWN43_4396 [Gammaproteobacteria bacterium]|nr:hypothetical protein [Gammaproteobacteria bacterium]